MPTCRSSGIPRTLHDHPPAPPANADLGRFFGVTAPSVHRMVLALQTRGLIRRTPGQARSIELLVPPQALPVLQPHPESILSGAALVAH